MYLSDENITISNILLLHLNEINMRFYGAEYNNIERGKDEFNIVVLCSIKLHIDQVSVVIVLLHTVLSYFNFEILWKFEIFETFWKFYHFEFFEILWNFWKLRNFMQILNSKKTLKF
jgi:hypothetical protein